MFCKNCGVSLNEGEKFCPNCGAQVTVEAADPQAAPQQGNYTQPAPDYGQQPQYNQYGQQPQYQQPQYNQYGQPVYDQPYAAAPEGTPGAKAHVTFKEAVILFFKNYIKFEGRSVISEYWYVVLFNVLVSVALGIVAGILSAFGGDLQSLTTVLSSLWSLATIIPSLAVAVRRMHDTGRSGWSILISLVPLVGWIIEIVWLCGASAGDNEYGPAARQ